MAAILSWTQCVNDWICASWRLVCNALHQYPGPGIEIIFTQSSTVTVNIAHGMVIVKIKLNMSTKRTKSITHNHPHRQFIGWLLTVFWRNWLCFNTLRPRQNGRYLAANIFKCIFLNENISISLKMSLNFVPKFQINDIPVMVLIMAWRRPGDKPLSEPMMVSLLMHICITRPQ